MISLLVKEEAPLDTQLKRGKIMGKKRKRLRHLLDRQQTNIRRKQRKLPVWVFLDNEKSGHDKYNVWYILKNQHLKVILLLVKEKAPLDAQLKRRQDYEEETEKIETFIWKATEKHKKKKIKKITGRCLLANEKRWPRQIQCLIDIKVTITSLLFSNTVWLNQTRVSFSYWHLNSVVLPQPNETILE